MTHIFDAPDLSATTVFGRRLAGLLFPGAVVALVGQLGAGKTLLVRAIAGGLDVVDSRAVSSPTFVLIQEYDARLPIYHFDAYRLKDARDFAALGVDEYFAADGVCLIEWADRVAPSLPAQLLRITIAITGETSRRFTVEGCGARYERIVHQLQAAPGT